MSLRASRLKLCGPTLCMHASLALAVGSLPNYPTPHLHPFRTPFPAAPAPGPLKPIHAHPRPPPPNPTQARRVHYEYAGDPPGRGQRLRLGREGPCGGRRAPRGGGVWGWGVGLGRGSLFGLRPLEGWQ